MRPKISGSGTDDNGAFTLPANSATDLNGSNTFWKTSTTGEMVHDVAFEAGSGSTGSFTAKGSYTSTSKTFGKSGSVERSGTFGINESAGDLAAMSSKTDMVMTYAGGSVDSMKAKFFPHFSGSGFDAHGSYSLSGSTTVAGTSGKANLSMTKTYTDGSSMKLDGEVPFPIDDVNECNRASADDATPEENCADNTTCENTAATVILEGKAKMTDDATPKH